MIIRGELKDTHRKRLSSLDRAVTVTVIPHGVTPVGVKVFRMLSRAFARHRFVMVVRRTDLKDPEISKEWKALKGHPNVFISEVKGGASGTDLAREYALLEKRASKDPEVEPR